MSACQGADGAPCGAWMLQVHFNVEYRNKQVGGCSSWVKIIFRDWKGYQCRKIKKLLFWFRLSGLLPAPVLSGGEQAGADTCRRRPWPIRCTCPAGRTQVGVSRSYATDSDTADPIHDGEGPDGPYTTDPDTTDPVLGHKKNGTCSVGGKCYALLAHSGSSRQCDFRSWMRKYIGGPSPRPMKF